MTDAEIVSEIAAQHALLLELTNQQRRTLAAVTALAELVSSMVPRLGALVSARQDFEERREAIHKELKRESVESLSQLQRAVAKQLLRCD
jgi:hypothetical protein